MEILLVEDNPNDAELAILAIRQGDAPVRSLQELHGARRPAPA